MKIEDVIESLNRHIERIREDLGIKAKGHLVLHKSIEVHPTIKIYKCYTYDVFFVNGRSKEIVINTSYKGRVPTTEEESVKHKLDIQLCTLMFEWVDSDTYRKVLKGECNGV